ncbi:hypothetical protein EXIGLDRAFT_772456 [Exidia glandulosa HHB12029]|uniref:Uncharacterized protein n=1 Tax=Exidia glandulosa HHB12029 TaxID=1314781 RepID=A0A165FBD1_EXIGL|nr:hypothetical protein EXIGLDRAFT_772456 [Exidia glandulosa HHB12029]
MSTNAHSHLLPDVLRVPLQERGYVLGHGVNALTGEPAGRRAVMPFAGRENVTQTPATNTSRTLWIKLCENYQDVRDVVSFDMNARVSANVHLLDVSVGAGVDIQKALQLSTTSFSLVAHWTRIEQETVLASTDYVLSEEARRCATHEPEAFRGRYGDYFVAGRSKGSVFTAIMTWKSSDSEALRRAKGGVHAVLGTAPVAFTAELGGSLDRIVTDNKVELEISIFLDGANGHPEDDSMTNLKSASRILEPLRWLQQNPAATDLRSVLWHFSRIVYLGELPREVNVSSSVFRELEVIKSLHFSCLMAVNGLPNVLHMHGNLISGLKERYSTIASDCRNGQRHLTYDEALRNELRVKLSELLRDLQECGVMSDQSPVGFAKFCHVEQKEPTPIIMPVGSKDVQLTIKVHDEEEQLVGWTVELLRGKGSWRVQRLPIILTREMTVTFRRDTMKSLKDVEWRFSIFVVRNKYLGALAPLVSAGSGSTLTTAENANVPLVP